MKIAFTLILNLLCLTVVADIKSDTLLSKLSTKLNGMGNYSMSFTLKFGGQNIDNGECVVNGDKFYINVLDKVIFSDGRNRYDMDGNEKEITINTIDPNDKNILSNPAKAFDLVGANFNSVHGGSGIRNGRHCEQISLTPLQKSSGFNNIKLWIDPISNLPVVLEYRMDGSPQSIEITVQKIESRKADNSLFEYSQTRYRGYEVIDFR